MGPGGFDEISIFLFLTCFSDEGWKPGPGQETNDTQMSQGDQNKHKPVYNDFRNICKYFRAYVLAPIFGHRRFQCIFGNRQFPNSTKYF